MVDPEQYRGLFVQEAREHVAALTEGLAGLGDPPERTSLDALFRAGHSFKGMAATLGFQKEADLAHALEDHLDQARASGRLAEAVIDALVRAVDRLGEAVDAIEAGEGPPPLDNEIARLRALLQPEAIQARDVTPPDPGLLVEAAAGVPVERRRYVRLRLHSQCIAPRARLLVVERSLRALGEIRAVVPQREAWADLEGGAEVWLLLASVAGRDEVLARLRRVPDLETIDVSERPFETRVPAATGEHPEPGRTAVGQKAKDAHDGADSSVESGELRSERPAAARTLPRTVRVDLDQMERLLDQAAELRIAHAQMERLLDEFIVGQRPYPLTEALERLDREAKAIHDTALELRTLPVRVVTERYPRLVRDLADRLGKSVRLEVEGADTQTDRSILEALADPLMHLIKNAIDHGIEAPEERVVAGKERRALLRIAFQRTPTGMRVEVVDDGRGIPRDQAVQKAVERGLVQADEAAALTDDEVYRLLATPGFSTTDEVTDVSGRGVGLDAVKAALERTGGSMRISSRTGRGTTVTLELPPTLAVVEALEVGIDGEPYYIPVDAVVTTTPVGPDQIARGVVDVVDPRRAAVPVADAEAIADADDAPEEALPVEPVRLIDLAALLELARPRYADVGGAMEKRSLMRGARSIPGDRRRSAPAEVPRVSAPKRSIGVVVERHGERACLVPDTIGLLREIVVKAFETTNARARFVAGATIRGDGRVGLILDVPSVLIASPRRVPRIER